MDFTIKSTSPSIAKIKSYLIEDRIDAEYFEVQHLVHNQKLKDYKAIRQVSDLYDVTKLSGFEYTEYFTKDELEKGEIPCVMSNNVGSNILNLDGCIKISTQTHQHLTRSKLQFPEVVLSYTGHYRRACVIPESLSNLHLGPNVCKLSPKDKECDSYFLATYLNCFYGQDTLDREKTISAQPTVNMGRIRTIKVPNPALLVQIYIGNKVRQAECLRDWGEQSKKIADLKFDNIVQQLGYSAKEKKKSTLDKTARTA